jgi:hypothetical protein
LTDRDVTTGVLCAAPAICHAARSMSAKEGSGPMLVGAAIQQQYHQPDPTHQTYLTCYAETPTVSDG